MRHDPLAYLATELDSLKQQGLYRRLRILEGEQKPTTTFDHCQVVNLSSNNYLGLTTHPKLRERALEATRTLGVGSGSVRTIAGTMQIHLELEDDEGFFRHRFPDGVDELSFHVHGVIKDVDRLRQLFDLFAEVLDELCRIGSAAPDDPGVKL